MNDINTDELVAELRRLRVENSDLGHALEFQGNRAEGAEAECERLKDDRAALVCGRATANARVKILRKEERAHAATIERVRRHADEQVASLLVALEHLGYSAEDQITDEVRTELKAHQWYAAALAPGAGGSG